MSTVSGAKRLRDLLDSGTIIVHPVAYDPLTARMVESAGFNAVSVAGWQTGASTCITEPLLTITEQIYVAERIARNVSIPVIMDGHTGGGNPANVARTVRETEAAGIAAIHIEDQVYPKRMGYHRGVKHIVPLEDALARIDAALNARRDPDFVIIARTDAWGAEGGGIEETVRRMRAFADAGADVVMPLVFDPDEAVRVRSAVPDVPMTWASGQAGLNMHEITDSHGSDRHAQEYTPDEVSQLGFQFIGYPVLIIVAAATAVYEQLNAIRETGKPRLANLSVGKQVIEELLSINDEYETERAALGGS